MNFHSVKCRYIVISAANHCIRVVFKHGVFFHTSSSNVCKSLLELVEKNTARSIKILRYSVAATKFKVFSTPLHGNSLIIKKMMNIFLTRSVRIQVQNNCKSHVILHLEVASSESASCRCQTNLRSEEMSCRNRN